MQVKILYQYF